MLIVNKPRSYKDQGHVHLLSARYAQKCAGSTIGNSMETDTSTFKEFTMEKGKQVKEANVEHAGKAP